MTAHARRAHAKLAPSAAHRWMNCPGSVRLSAGVEEAPSAYAAEGTAAHMLAEVCLSGGHDAERFRGHIVDTAAKGTTVSISPSSAATRPDRVTRFEVDEEMIEGVQLHLDTVHAIGEEADEIEIEHRLDLGAFIPGSFGTGDAVAYVADRRRVVIVDLKYGKGVAVEATDNKQLLTYAAGATQRYHNRGVDEVELIIVQPRAPHPLGPVRRWLTDLVGLYEHIAALQRAAASAERRDAPFAAGDWCKFCKAAAFCPTLAASVLEIVSADSVDGEIFTMSDPSTFDPNTLSKALRNATRVANWVKSVENFAHAEAMRGRIPPGWKLVGKRPVRKWVDEGAALSSLQMLGISDDDLFETKMRSPAQVEKVLPRKERGVLEPLVEKVSSGTVLAALDDPRPSVDPTQASGFDAVEIDDDA